MTSEDLGVQTTGPPRPIHRLEKFASKNAQTSVSKGRRSHILLKDKKIIKLFETLFALQAYTLIPPFWQ